MTDEPIFKVNGQIESFANSKIDPETGEIFDPHNNALAEFEAIEMQRAHKQKGLILWHKNLGGKVDIIDNEIARLQKLKTVIANKQKSAKWLLEQSMLHNDERAVDFDTCKASFRKNPPRVIIEPGAEIEPYTHEEVVKKIDKQAIKDALKEGVQIKGCKLEQDDRLDIK